MFHWQETLGPDPELCGVIVDLWSGKHQGDLSGGAGKGGLGFTTGLVTSVIQPWMDGHLIAKTNFNNYELDKNGQTWGTKGIINKTFSSNSLQYSLSLTPVRRISVLTEMFAWQLRADVVPKTAGEYGNTHTPTHTLSMSMFGHIKAQCMNLVSLKHKSYKSHTKS